MTNIQELLRTKNSLRMGPEEWARMKQSPGWFKDGIVAVDHFIGPDASFEIAEFIAARAGWNGQKSDEYQLSLLVGCQEGGYLEVDFGAGKFIRPNCSGQFLFGDNEEIQFLQGTGPFHSISMALKKNLMQAHLKELANGDSHALRSLLACSFRDEDLEVMMKGLLHACRHGELTANKKSIDARLRCMVRRLLEIGQRMAPGSLARSTTLPGELQLAVEYLSKNISRETSVEKLAAVAGMSAGHFRRQFRQALGMSPKDYQMRLRLEMAKELLKKAPADQPISEIAQQSGFASRSHLSTELRRTLALSPNEYRALSE